MTNIINEPKYKRRTGSQIIMEIFDYLKQHPKAKKTWLLNVSRLNSKNFETYFNELLEKKYIEYDPKEKGSLILTPHGIVYMNYLKNPPKNTKDIDTPIDDLLSPNTSNAVKEYISLEGIRNTNWIHMRHPDD